MFNEGRHFGGGGSDILPPPPVRVCERVLGIRARVYVNVSLGTSQAVGDFVRF